MTVILDILFACFDLDLLGVEEALLDVMNVRSARNKKADNLQVQTTHDLQDLLSVYAASIFVKSIDDNVTFFKGGVDLSKSGKNICRRSLGSVMSAMFIEV